LKHGLKPKVHANQLSLSGGVEAGVKYAAQSVDHLEFVGAEQIEILKQSDTMPVLLPGASFFLHSRYAQARQLIDAGLPVALASDYNPGTSPSGNMQLVMSLACIKLRMLPEEALNAVTINGAYAMAVDDSLGSIACGKTANLIITKPIQSLSYIPYSFGSNSIETVILHGKVQKL